MTSVLKHKQRSKRNHNNGAPIVAFMTRAAAKKQGKLIRTEEKG